MAIEAPISKFRKNGFKLYIGFCLIIGIVLAYDGYLSKYEWSGRQSFYQKHVKEGKPDDTMMFNKIAPVGLVILAGFFFARLQAIKDKKIIADDSALIIDAKERIPYDSIQKIDKTHFKSKGHFTITYNQQTGQQLARRISDRKYDNLQAVLDKLINQIT